MSNKFDAFFRDHRDAFDDEEPGARVWEGIQKQWKAERPAPARVIPLMRFRWAAAALLILGMGLGALYLVNRRGDSPPMVKGGQSTEAGGHTDIYTDIDPNMAREVYHFTQLIEIKQEELKAIESEHPDLYREFMGDIDKLDSSYNALKKELPSNPNREQLLEAMIQNLQLQADLLNRQLTIIQQIKQSKNKSNESNSKAG